MHTDGIVLLALDAALLGGIFLYLSRIHSRLTAIERRILLNARKPRQKTVRQKKD